MTVHTWYTSARDAGIHIGRTTQETGTRGNFRKFFSIDIEQTSDAIFVTIAAGSLKECMAEFRRKAESIGIPAEKWGRFDIPLTENAARAVQAWAKAVRGAIDKRIDQATADSSGAL